MTPEELRTARATLLMTQQELADALGVNLRTLQAWETGRYKLPDLLLPALWAVQQGWLSQIAVDNNRARERRAETAYYQALRDEGAL